MERRRIVKVGAISYAQLVKLLLDGLYTTRELAEQTGLHYVTVCQYTRELYRAKAVYICDWQPDTRDRDCLKIYKIGTGKDKLRRKLSAKERQRRHRQAKRGKGFSLSTLGAISSGVRGEDGASVADSQAPGLSDAS